MKKVYYSEYTETDTYQTCALPYVGRACIYFVVPKERFGVDQVLKDLTLKNLKKIFNAKEKRIDVRKLKFNLAYVRLCTTSLF